MATLQPSHANTYAVATTALLIADRQASDAMQALEVAGIRLRAQTGFADAAERMAEAAQDLILIEAAAVGPAPLSDVLALARSQHASSVLVTIAPDQIDLATAYLLGGRCQLLCDPSMAERVAAIALARVASERRAVATLHDVTRDAEYGRLQRLNEEVARIADVLARLTRGEESDRPAGGVRAPDNAYRGPDDDGSVEITAQEIRTVIRSRRLRAQFFAPDLFADPAWDMLLDLFAAGLERRRVSVSSLCIAAAVPPTTALRWIGTLHEAGLFERQADPSDRRRAYIGLSAKGLAGMRSYVSAAKRAGLGLV